MRILVSTLTPYPSGTAHAVHIAATARGFVEAGHHVTLVSAQSGPGWPAGERPGDAFEVRTLAARDHRGQSIVNFPRLVRLVRDLRPDLAFADDVRSGLVLARSGVPVIVEFHSMQFHASRLSRAALRSLRQRAELRGLVTISQALRADLADATGIDVGLISVLTEAARPRTDKELVAAAPSWVAASMRTGTMQVGYTGSLYGGRGVDLMLALAQRVPDVDVHVLGGPDDAADALRGRPDRPSNLHVHGLRPVADAERLQAAMDVLLAPYERSVSTPGGVDTSRWMSPMKIFEYLAAGRAVIASDLPVLREILEDGLTALLVDPEDIGSWVAAVMRLRDDVGLRTRLGSRGRVVHSERSTWEVRTDRLLNLGMHQRG